MRGPFVACHVRARDRNYVAVGVGGNFLRRNNLVNVSLNDAAKPEEGRTQRAPPCQQQSVRGGVRMGEPTTQY